MNTSLCGADCAKCPSKEACPGCAETGGCPFGKQYFVAKYILTGGMDAWRAFKAGLIGEINALEIPGMAEITELYPLVGSFVNLEYPLPCGAVKLLCDDEVYLGAQVENVFDDSKKTCFGVIAREGFLMVCEYSEGGAGAQLVLYKRR